MASKNPTLGSVTSCVLGYGFLKIGFYDFKVTNIHLIKITSKLRQNVCADTQERNELSGLWQITFNKKCELLSNFHAGKFDYTNN